MKTKRSSTLFEVLIALSLLAALVALIVPSFTSMVDERAFESATDGTGDQLQLARAHSQTTQTPVEVVYRANPPRVEARFFTPWTERSAENGGSGADEAYRVFADWEGDRGRIEASWASRAFESGISIRRAEQAWEVFGATVDAADEERRGGFVPGVQEQILAGLTNPAVETEGGMEEDIRLAVFMPDGSAVVGEQVRLEDESGRRSRLIINPWTGLPMFEREDGPEGEKAEGELEEDDDAARGRRYGEN